MTGYNFHPEAEQDVIKLWDHIAGNNPAAADRVTDAIVAALDSLVRFPHHGHLRPDLTSRPLRFWSVRDYLIAYAPDEKPLWVIAVLHGSRNPRVMTAILRGREIADQPR